jgi:hypothetical protein
MQKRGLTVHTVSPEDETAWRELLKKAYPQIRGRMVPTDIFDEVEQLLKDRHAAKGGTP